MGEVGEGRRLLAALQNQFRIFPIVIVPRKVCLHCFLFRAEQHKQGLEVATELFFMPAFPPPPRPVAEELDHYGALPLAQFPEKWGHFRIYMHLDFFLGGTIS
jgi:hypothetical protein